MKPQIAPEIRVLSRREFLYLTGLSLAAVCLGTRASANDAFFPDGVAQGELQVKMPDLPCCSPAYCAARVPDGSFVVWTSDPSATEKKRAYGLNGSGAYILGLCDGTRSTDAIELACRKAGIPAEEVLPFMRRLEQIGIVVGGGFATLGRGYPGAQNGDTYAPRFE